MSDATFLPGPYDLGGGCGPIGDVPSWAVKAAVAWYFPADYAAVGYEETLRRWGHLRDTQEWGRIDRLAELLVSTREAALREAADATRRAEPQDDDGSWPDLDDAAKAILALIDKEPS